MLNKQALITGANSGIGFESARGLLKLGYSVAITGRNSEKLMEAKSQLQSEFASSTIDTFVGDFASFKSTRVMADEIGSKYDAIDVLINNAGLILSERQESEDGYELTFQINHLSPFLLTLSLWDSIKAANHARVVNLSSMGHKMGGPLRFNDLQATKKYDGVAVYNRSKLCNIYFTRSLAQRCDPKKVVINAVHPGVVKTGFAQDGDTTGFWGMFFGLMPYIPFFLTPQQGARTSIHVASNDAAGNISGEYWSGSKVAKTARYAKDDCAAERLWQESLAMTGIDDPFQSAS